MKKITINFITDIIAFACMVFLVSSGVILKYLLPPGSGKWLNLWSLNRHQWGDLHFWLAVVFLGVIAFHLVMHWRWLAARIVGNHNTFNRKRGLYTLLALVALIAIAAAPMVTFYSAL